MNDVIDLGCCDVGCSPGTEKGSNEVSSGKENEEGIAAETATVTTKAGKIKAAREASPTTGNVLNKFTSQIKKPSYRKGSPINWFPRKKVDSYLKRKIKLLQEIGGMNSSLDETLGDSNPHYTIVEKEKIAAREATQNVVNARKTVMIEASWCRILQAARIQNKEAETLLSKAEQNLAEAYDVAMAMGVIMYNVRNCFQKPSELETRFIHGGDSTVHAVAASFETAFEVDKEVAAAIKTALTKLANSSISKDEFKGLLQKISQNPDIDGGLCESENAERFQQSDRDPENLRNLVDLMFERLRYLQEEELTSLARIVATCGLNAALAEAGNLKHHCRGSGDGFKAVPRPSFLRRTSSLGTKQAAAVIPGLDKFLVKHTSKLEREVQEAKNSRTKESRTALDEDSNGTSDTAVLPGLGSILVKHRSKLEREVELARETSRKMSRTDRDLLELDSSLRMGNVRTKQVAPEVPGLDQCLVKHVSRLEREVQEAKNKKRLKNSISNGHEEKEIVSSDDLMMVKSKTRDGGSDLRKKEDGLDQILVKHKSKLEREKIAAAAAAVRQPGEQTKNGLPKEARERELEKAWGGLSLGNSMRPRLSILEREKAAWRKAADEGIE